MFHAPPPVTAPPAAAARGPGPAVRLPVVESIAAFGVQVSRQFVQCRREGGQLALLWVDVEVLATPGSGSYASEREALIQNVSQRLRNRVRGSDEVVRVGEHGFAVLLLAAGAPEARLVAQRLLQALRGTYGVEGRQSQVGVRVGTAIFPESGRNGAELAEAARASLATAP
ncbi:MAG: diguanylate cyclase [Roseateles sp.]|uniref:diguanylate cyclase domain-containing protein n=1 Tax=Roseateles sp. TaxID=1971397 RepID=UPI0039E8A975